MPRQRTPIEMLRLQGNDRNLRRAAAREKNATEIALGDAEEIENLNVLIGQTMAECKHGATLSRKGKANPAFRSLAILIACRETLRGRSRLPIRKSADQLLKSVDSLLATPAEGKPS